MMRHARQIAGQRFGRLVAIEDSGQREQRRVVWRCACDCGSDAFVPATRLVRGVTSSCGCLQKELASAKRLADLHGKRFGRLVVLALHSRPGGGAYSRWLVRCDCGTEKVLRSGALVSGETISCGCARTSSRLRSPEARAKNVVRTARRRALKLAASGDFTETQIAELYRKQRGCCAWCHKKLGDRFHRDHRVALSQGGSNDISNIELLCGTCNTRKHAKDPIRWANENGRLL